MIQSPPYNGINFSGDFARTGKYDFDSQRVKSVLPKAGFRYVSFFCTGVVDHIFAKMTKHGATDVEIMPSIVVEGENVGDWYFYFEFSGTEFVENEDCYFSFEVDGPRIYSEIYTIRSNEWLTANDWCMVVAFNADDRHGFLSRETTAFFHRSIFNADTFINKEVVYEYSYNRKKILSSENSIAKKITFHDLSMYNRNLLKWLCKCETLFIDGVSYQLISDWTELETDPSSEVKSLQADFIQSTQTFFADGVSTPPTNVFAKQFFTK